MPDLDWILASFKKPEKTSFLSCSLGKVYANICFVSSSVNIKTFFIFNALISFKF